MAKKMTAKSAKRALTIAKNTKKTAQQRVDALTKVTPTLHDEDNLLEVVSILADKSEPLEVRQAALSVMELASFSSPVFENCRGDYLAALRKVTKDANEDLRTSALGILASEGDGFAQKKLLAGLKDEKKALVPPDQALKLLSYNVHNEVYDVAREIIKKPPSDDAKYEALRVLAADAGSNKLFEKLLLDKKETRKVREICAVALQSMKPDKLYQHAKELVRDDSEDDNLRATCLTALSQFADVADDDDLVKQVQGLKQKAKSRLKKSATQFLDRYGK